MGDELSRNIATGQGRKSFADAVNSAFDKAGVSKLHPYQIDNIYKTNTQLAYAAGQMEQMLELADDFPYWQYSAVIDSRVEASHARLHGKIFKVGDFRFYPPLRFNCRCTAIPLTAEEAQARGGIVPTQQKNALKEQVGDNEFFGNKQASFLKWLDKNKKTLGAKSAKMIDKALRKMQNKTENLLESDITSKIKKSFANKTLSDKDLDDLFRLVDSESDFFDKGFRAILEEPKKEYNGSTDMYGLIYLRPDIIKNCKLGIQNILRKKPTTFNQEQALSTLWHEITHNRHKLNFQGFPKSRAGRMARWHTEVANEFVSRKTLPEFFKTLGGKMQHTELMSNRSNTEYNHWVRNYEHLVDVSGADKSRVLDDVRKYLFEQDYTTQIEGLKRAITKNSNMTFKDKALTKDIFEKYLLQDSEEEFRNFVKANKDKL